MSTGKIILVVLATVVIFAAGVVTGGILVKQTVRPPATPPAVFNRFDIARRALNQLDLTPEQRARIDRILRENQERIADYLQILDPEIQGSFRQMQADIRAQLTPEQRKLYDERLQRLRRPFRSNAGQGLRPDGSDARPGPGRSRPQAPVTE